MILQRECVNIITERKLDEIEKSLGDVREHIFEGTMIPLIAHEQAETRHMQREKRQHIFYGIIIGILIMVLAGTNMAWLYVFQSYDYVTETIKLDSQDGGNANYIGNDGDIHNGKSDSDKKNKEEIRK